MEDLLLNIVKEANGSKLSVLKQVAQEAHDLLSSQCNGLLRTPSYELRASCFKPLRLALESKRTKLVAYALAGLHKIVRDERFQAGSEPEDDSLWLPAQLLHATTSMLTHCEDTQVHILRVFLGLACGASWALNGRLVMLLLGRCGEAYEVGTQPIRAAAQAAASQTVTAFCTFLDEECQDILQQQQKYKNAGNSSAIVYSQISAVACFNEVIPVMQYICSRLEEIRMCTKVNDITVFLLECLLTLVSTLPQTVHQNTHFTTFLWQRFCPALLSLLGTPGDPASQGLTTNQAKIVYSIGIQLVRLVGSEPALRPVLEALFHRMLLLPGPVRRLEPLRAIKELLRSPGRLADLLLLKNGTQRHAGDDMAIIRLIMDSIEESSQCNDSAIMLASVECVVALLTSLDSLSKGEGLTHEGAVSANTRYTHLEQADYKGPLTYQSLARLPKPYRDVVANLKYQSDSDSSGIDGGTVGDRHTDEEGTESDNSGATEGPEDNGSDSEDSILDNDSFLTNQELQRLQKLPKALHLGRSGIEECNVDVERHNAKHFVKTLQNILLPNLLSLRSSIQVDEILQEFASKCCQHNSAQNFEIKTIMNADGIYLATYSALLLNLRLIQIGHYDKNNTSVKVPLTETQFVEEVYGSGVLVYLSATWLSELYQQVLAISLLESAGYDPNSGQQYALINLLKDVGGLGSNQLLSDWQKLERVQTVTTEPSVETEAGIKLARRVLTCCWDSMVMVLSGPLDETPNNSSNLGDKASTLGLLLPRRTKRMQHKKKIRDNLVTSSLEGLHKAASLSNTLKLQARSSSILSLLSNAACRQSGSKLHAAHALSLDVLLSKGLALGSHNSACWPHVFSACIHVAKLEHSLFSKAGSTQMLLVAQNANTVVTTTSTTERLNLSFNLSQDEETCVDVYSFLQSSNYATNTQNTETSVADVINKSGAHNTNHGLLTNVDAAKVCCLLSQQVDSLFHEAALKLNLPCLCAFLEELCTSSQRQIFSRAEQEANETRKPKKKWWKRELESEQKPVATLLLHRIGDVTLKCIRAGRPLVHTMRVWAIVGPHFMEAACHKDQAISKKAIACIHDSVTALLNENVELPHFHFNEALFKPFENLLCLELCDYDVQDQIVACLCEFVEANRTEICSGWRPLFGTLRVANTNNNNAAAICEVFKVFLSTDNTLVFANAALDYILCLLTHIRGIENQEIEDCDNMKKTTIETINKKIVPETPKTPTDKITGFLENLEQLEGTKYNEITSLDLCREALKYLQNCVTILEMMYNMPKCPTFNLSHRVQIDMDPQLVDSIIPNVDSQSLASETDIPISYKILSTKYDLEECERQNITLSRMDKQSGVLQVWYILLEGLASNTIICTKANQPFALETLFKLLKELIVCPGTNFGLYCINHILLPMVQNWLRQNSKLQKAWESVGPNFKQCVGMATELIVEYLHHTQSKESSKADRSQDSPVYYSGTKIKSEPENPAMTLALKQLLIILIECISQPNENVARLGTSCIRHIISSGGLILSCHQWQIMVIAIHRACTISLNPLRQLTQAFKPNSDSFYGDLSTVKVAARKDCTVEENLKLYQLAQQVFVISSQRECQKCNSIECNCKDTFNLIDDRSYVFLLYPLELGAVNSELYSTRVPFRNIVVGILAHQMLIQTISSALLQNLNHITPIFNILQINNYSLRGILNKVNAKHVNILLECMEMSSLRAKEFDERPGLKFLMQKVGNLNKAANLYTQANTSEVVQIIVLIELCLDGIEKYKLSKDDLGKILLEIKKIDCVTDLDYIHLFLLRLNETWESLVNKYVNLTLKLEEMNPSLSTESLDNSAEISEHITKSPSDTENEHKPFKFADFILPEENTKTPDDEERVFVEDNHQEPLLKNSPKSRELNKSGSSFSVNETTVDAKKNDFIQTRSISVSEFETKINKETEMKIEAMMEQYRQRKPYHNGGTPNTRTNPFVESVPPPQAVPPEIQQQRLFSIHKDAECYKMTQIETIEACLELLGSLPPNRIAPLAPVLGNGAQLLTTASDEKIQQASHTLLKNLQLED